MAIIGSIQKHAYITATVIAAALILFLVEIVSPNMNILTRDNAFVGKVNGETFHTEEFEAKYKEKEQEYVAMKGGQALTDVEQFSLKNQIWSEFLTENVINKGLEKMGLAVTGAEIAEFIMGENADQNFKSAPAFQNAQGQFDPSLVAMYIKNLDKDDPNTPKGSKRKQWTQMEKQIKQNRLLTKFQSLVQNSSYVPKWLTTYETNNYTKAADINYVFVPYASVNDKDIKTTDEDLKKYFEENIAKFKLPSPMVKSTYAVFPLKPSNADSVELITKFQAKVEQMRTATNDTTFFKAEGDRGYDAMFYKKSDLTRYTNVDTIFGAGERSIVGPFIAKESFKAVKILKKKNISDSVKVRAITISFADVKDQGAYDKKLKLVDSVFKMLDTLNMSFDMVAANFSADKGQTPAFWISTAEKAWNPEIFFHGGSHKYFKSPSQQEGAMKILHVEEFPANIPAIQIGEISAPYAPSTNTTNEIFTNANNFKNSCKTAKDFEKNIKKYPNAKTSVTYLSQNENTLGDLDGNSREITRWAFTQSERNDISGLIQVGNNYVICINEGLRDKDHMNFEDFKDQVAEYYKGYAKMKFIKSKMSNAKSLADAGKAFGTMPLSASAVSLRNASFTGSPEPVAVSVAITTAPNALSKPVQGGVGVFMIQPTKVYSNPLTPAEQLQLNTQLQQSVKNKQGILEGMIENANIVDNRVNIF
jgi:peptidyl-prolyl cis-trans isomerase D